MAMENRQGAARAWGWGRGGQGSGRGSRRAFGGEGTALCLVCSDGNTDLYM